MKENYEFLVDSKYSEIKSLFSDINKNKYTLEEQKQIFKQKYMDFTIYFCFYEESAEILNKYGDDLYELSSETETLNKIKEQIKNLTCNRGGNDTDHHCLSCISFLKELKYQDQYKEFLKNERCNNVKEERNNNNNVKDEKNNNDKDEIKIIESGSIKELLEKKKEIEELELQIRQTKKELIKGIKSFHYYKEEIIEDYLYKPVKIKEYNEEKPEILFKEYKYNKEIDQKPDNFKKKKFILFFVVAIVIIVGLIGRILLK